jgi:aminoglycoside phosphotransferase (APT) family kinase protein
MTIHSTPPAEIVVDAPLVRALLLEQHPDLADLPLTDGHAGWDNQVYRLGDSLAVRLPRRAAAATLIVREQQWLPLLAPRLPLPVSAPARVGRPGHGFPWSWSVVPWFEGESGAATSINALPIARDLGRFLQALHRPAPPDAPLNPWRGVPLSHRAPSMADHITRVGDRLDRVRVLAAWEHLVRTPPWPAAPLWIHGDVHPGNLVLRDGRMSAVIDFGDLAAGDPATDLSVAWMTMSASVRLAFRDAARSSDSPIDDDTWARARGWALALGVAYLAHSRNDPRLQTLGATTVEAVLSEQQ